MSRRKGFLSRFLLMTQVVISSGFIVTFLPTSVNAKADAILYSIRPATVKQYNLPYPLRYNVGFLNSDLQLKQKEPVYKNHVRTHGDDIFQIEASDAIDGTKYSQPDVAYSLFSSNSGLKVPSSTFLKQKLIQTLPHNFSPENYQDQTFPSYSASDTNSMKPLRDIRYLDSAVDEGTKSDTSDSSNKLRNNLENIFQTYSYDGNTTNLYTQGKNNFTDASDNLVSVSSDAVLSYEVPSMDFNDSSDKSSVKQNTGLLNDVPSLNTYDVNSTTLLPVLNTVLPEQSTQNSVSLNTHVYIEFSNQTNLTENIMSTSVSPSTNYDDNVTISLPSTDSERKFSSGTVAGIVIAVLVSVTLLSSAVIYLLYRKFNGKCTSVVESKFNTDNCGYLDDSLRSSIYLNNHIELPKESSEEMTSLDNDSFLNSLETMTIQNYWADNSKNTKV